MKFSSINCKGRKDMKRFVDANNRCESEENYLPLVSAVEKATGHRPHLSTILRWCTKGARGRKLASAVIGGRRMTTVAAVREFIVCCPGSSGPGLQIPRNRSTEIDRSVARLMKRTGATNSSAPSLDETNRSHR
jgi:hypothetical protein